MVESILFTVFSDLLFLVLLFVGGFLFSIPFYKIYKGEYITNCRALHSVEDFIYKISKVDPKEEMNAKQFTLHVCFFSLFSFIFLMAILMLQGFLLGNPNGIENMSFTTAFNTAISFVSNTNWQAYSGETSISYLSATVGLTVQNFVSGAVGISVMFALLRGFTRKETNKLGNFYVDIVKCSLFMVPVCFVYSLILVTQGVPQTFDSNQMYAAYNGTNQMLYLGPVASQVSIKQLFTNGGGFYGTNSAYPLENPTALSNLLECNSMLWIPIALCFVMSKELRRLHKTPIKGTKLVKVKSKFDDGISLLTTMSIIFVVCLTLVTVFEYMGGNLPDTVSQIGNMEGKESRFGIGASALWSVVTTSASNGSVNAMHDSFTPLGGMIPLFLMMLGEIVYGGVGCGLYGMIAFALLTVFISGLMVGRTPEYLGKKIGAFDMKMVCLIILPSVLLTLISSASTVLLINENWLTNSGAHGFTEILYAFVSQSNNNGSAFAGFLADTPWTNIVGGICMLVNRFVPMIATLFLASSLAKKKYTPQSDGTLLTNNLMFVNLLIAVIIVIGALSFFPALSLGPIADFVS